MSRWGLEEQLNRMNSFTGTPAEGRLLSIAEAAGLDAR